jgi:predicted nuclease of predicted toxin-antitoxin system
VKFLADESVDRPIVSRLRQDGHEVIAVADLEPSVADEAVLARANETGALLPTVDKDVGELVFRQRQVAVGVVLMRPAGLPTQSKAETISAVVRDHGSELPGAFTVISPGMVRIRPRD